MTDDQPSARARLLLSANSAWNVAHFRLGLIEGLREAGFEVVVAAPADGHEAAILDRGLTFIPIAMDRSGMSPLADIALLGRYVAIFRRSRPAAFLGFTIKPNVYGSIAARLLRVPAINNVSGLGTMFLGMGWQSRLAHRLYRLAFARSRTVFFQNPDDRELFVQAGTVKSDQTALLPGSGINLQRFAPTKPVNGPPVFLFVGRLLADKGIREFVEAAAIVRSKLPKARFQVLGGTDEGNRTSIPPDEVDRWKDDGNVEFLGDAADVRPFIAGASAVVLPSYREGLPRVLLEAGATGRPSIASDVPGCNALIRPGENGLLCAVRDPGALAEAMLQFARLDEAERLAMGEAARTIVEREYGEQRVVDAYLAALRDIAPASGVGSR